jgi:heme exporter protein CcmD
MSFWAMGGYAAFIWPAYAVSAIGILVALVWTLSAYGGAKKRVKELERGK